MIKSYSARTRSAKAGRSLGDCWRQGMRGGSFSMAMLPLLAFVTVAVADEPDGPVVYRREHIQANQVEKYLAGKGPYREISAEEFERLQAAATVQARKLPASVATRIEKAHYEARLGESRPGGGQTLTGTATLQIAHDGAEAVFFPWGNCSLVIEAANWSTEGGRAARIGLAAGGQQVLFVSEQGQLHLDWTLPGRVESPGVVRYDLSLPLATMASLSLELEDAVTPHVEGGSIEELLHKTRGRRRWLVQFDGRPHVTLRLTTKTPRAEASGVGADNRGSYRQRVVYDVSPRGLDARTQLFLDVKGQPVQEVVAEVPETARIVSVRLADVDVPWTRRDAAETGIHEVVFRFPKPLTGSANLLRVEMAALVVEDQVWDLPVLRPRHLTWEQGQRVLNVRRPLSLAQLLTSDATQSDFKGLSAATGGESLSFEEQSPGAKIRVRIETLAAEPKVSSFLRLDMGEREIVGRMVVEVRATEGKLFALAGEMADYWQVESVESNRPDDDLRWEVTRRKEGRQQIEVQLAQGISSTASTRLTFTGRWPRSPLGRTLNMDDLRMLAFPGSRRQQRAVFVEASDPLELDVTGADQLRLVDLDQLTLARDEDLAGHRGGLSFADDEGAQSLQVTLRRQSPRFATENNVSLRLEDGRQQESYRIVCTPESTAIDRMLVHFSTRCEEEALTWSIGDGGSATVAARKWLPEETEAASLGSGGETWELEFGRSMSERFEIHAQRNRAVEGRVPVSLVFVPQASDQLGGVVIHAGTGTAVSLHNRDLIPIPARAAGSGENSTIRGAFRYEPIRHAQLDGEPPLEVEAVRAETAFVWHAHVTSRYELSGRVAHEAIFQLENAGQSRVVVKLPSGSETRAVYADDVPLEFVAGGDELSIDLPTGRRFPVVRVRYDAMESPLTRYRHLSPTRPRVDVPVLSWWATILTPPGFEIVSANGATAPSAEAFSLRDRILGPLGDATLPLGRGGEVGGGGVESAAPREPVASGNAVPSLLTVSRRWNIYQGAFSSLDEPSLLLLHRSVLTTLAWTSFLVVATGLIYAAPKSLRIWSAVLLVLGMLALLLPPLTARVAAGAFSGAILAVIVALARLRGCAAATRVIVRDESAPAPALEGSTIMRASHVCFLAIVGSFVFSAQSVAEQPAVDDQVHRVVIPVGEDKQRVGDSIFIPQEMHAELVDRKNAASMSREQWMLTESVYRGVLDPSGAELQSHLTSFVGTFELETFANDVPVAFSMSRKEIALRGAVTLDGRKVAASWNEAGDRIVLHVPNRGKYRVVIPLEVDVQANDGIAELKMAVPPLPASRIELQTSSDVNHLAINGVPQAFLESDNANVVVAPLGAKRQLHVSWRRERRHEREVRVDEFVWMRVRPQEVAFEARWKVRRGAAFPKRMRVHADRRLRLLTSAKDAFVVVQQFDDAEGQKVHVIERLSQARPLRDLRLSFEVRGGSGVGRVKVPELTLSNVSVDRQYVSLSVDAALDYEIQDRSILTAINVEEVARDWGIRKQRLGTAFLVSDGSRPSTVVVQTTSREPVTVYESELVLGFEESQARVLFEAEIGTEGGQLFQHQMQVPSNFEARSVSLLVRGEDRLHRWSQTNDGRLTLFFTEPLSGRQQLSIQGVLATDGDDIGLPRFVLRNATPKARRMAFFRRNEVVVNLEGTSGVQEISGPAGSLLSLVEPAGLAFGRQVGVYELDAVADGSIRVVGNHPRIRSEQTTRLTQERGDWGIVIDYRTEVESGSVGTLRFDIPPSMADPISISPRLSYRLVELPNSQVRQLIIYPREAITSDFSLQIRAPLTFAAGDRVRVPDVRIVGDVDVERTIIMPRQVDGQRIFWEVQGLQPLKSLPGELRVRVAANAFSAAVAAVAPRRGDPQVRLLNLRTTLTRDDDFFSVASFDLEPAGRKACRLVMPEGAEIRSVRVAELPTDVPLGEQNPVINLGSDQLPHRIEVVYRGRVQDDSGELKIGVPSLYDVGTDSEPVAEGLERRMEVERSFWTVAAEHDKADSELTLGLASSGDQQVSTSLVRDLEYLSIISDLVADVTSEQPNEVLAHWYQRWAQRIDRQRRRIEPQVETIEDAAELARIRDRLRDVEQQQAILEERFAGLLPLVKHDERSDVNRIVPSEAADSDVALVLSRRGAPGELKLLWKEPPGQPVSRRLLVAGAYALVLAIGWVVSRSHYFSDVLWRWPHVAGVLAGVAVSIAWSPVVLGMVLIAICLSLVFRYPLARQRTIG